MLRRKSWKLMLVFLMTSFSMACQQKREWPRGTRLMSRALPNPVVIVGNGTAYGRILEGLRSR